jgi:hypothetical protein
MKKILLQVAQDEVFEENGRYFIISDVGTICPRMRQDEISKEDAEYASVDVDNLSKFLFQLQDRLIAQGIDPYQSNITPPTTIDHQNYHSHP